MRNVRFNVLKNREPSITCKQQSGFYLIYLNYLALVHASFKIVFMYTALYQ